MGNCDNCSLVKFSFNHVLDKVVCFLIYTSCCFIHKKHFWLFDQDSNHTHQLSLTQRKVFSVGIDF